MRMDAMPSQGEHQTAIHRSFDHTAVLRYGHTAIESLLPLTCQSSSSSSSSPPSPSPPPPAPPAPPAPPPPAPARPSLAQSCTTSRERSLWRCNGVAKAHLEKVKHVRGGNSRGDVAALQRSSLVLLRKRPGAQRELCAGATSVGFVSPPAATPAGSPRPACPGSRHSDARCGGGGARGG